MVALRTLSLADGLMSAANEPLETGNGNLIRTGVLKIVLYTRKGENKVCNFRLVA
jgi:hypothetical protein